MNETIQRINELQNQKRQSNAKVRKDISIIQCRNRIEIGRLDREIDELNQVLSAEARAEYDADSYISEMKER